MKFLLVCLVVICFSSVYSDTHAETDREKLDIRQCMADNKVTKEMLLELDTKPDFVPTRDMHCFAACVLKKKNWMDENGKFTKTYMETDLKDECKTEYGKDECETAGKLMACVVRVIKEDRMDKMKANAEKSS